MKEFKEKMKNSGKILKILLFMIGALIMEGKELRIMSYNIYGARLADGKKLGSSIKKYKPDFISLQEVDKNTKRSNLSLRIFFRLIIHNNYKENLKFYG